MTEGAQRTGSDKTAVRPFTVNVPEAELTELRRRINAARWPRETGDRHREGRALNNLGLALREAGQLAEAIAAHQDAAAIFRETGDPHRESLALSNLETAQTAQSR
jgi:tetratricopeptide (TPR) repeat protein